MKQPDNFALNSARFNAGPVGTHPVITAAKINCNDNFFVGLIFCSSRDKQLGKYPKTILNELALLNFSMGSFWDNSQTNSVINLTLKMFNFLQFQC